MLICILYLEFLFDRLLLFNIGGKSFELIQLVENDLFDCLSNFESVVSSVNF